MGDSLFVGLTGFYSESPRLRMDVLREHHDAPPCWPLRCCQNPRTVATVSSLPEVVYPAISSQTCQFHTARILSSCLLIEWPRCRTSFSVSSQFCSLLTDPIQRFHSYVYRYSALRIDTPSQIKSRFYLVISRRSLSLFCLFMPSILGLRTCPRPHQRIPSSKSYEARFYVSSQNSCHLIHLTFKPASLATSIFIFSLISTFHLWIVSVFHAVYLYFFGFSWVNFQFFGSQREDHHVFRQLRGLRPKRGGYCHSTEVIPYFYLD